MDEFTDFKNSFLSLKQHSEYFFPPLSVKTPRMSKQIDFLNAFGFDDEDANTKDTRKTSPQNLNLPINDTLESFSHMVSLKGSIASPVKNNKLKFWQFKKKDTET